MKNQRRPLRWYREAGLLFLGLALVCMVTAFFGKNLAASYPEHAALFNFGKWMMAAGFAIAFPLALILLFVWMTLRKDPEVY